MCPQLWFYPYVQSVTSFPGGASGKEPACQCRRLKRQGFDPSPGGGHGNPLQYSCLKNPMNRGAWGATVHGVTKSRTRLKRLSTHACGRSPCAAVCTSPQPGIPRGLCSLILSTPLAGLVVSGRQSCLPCPSSHAAAVKLPNANSTNSPFWWAPHHCKIESQCLHRACRDLRDCALATLLLPHDHTHLTVLQLALCLCMCVCVCVCVWDSPLHCEILVGSPVSFRS